MSKKKTKLIDGIRYYADRPNNCKHCFFWKNKKAGCILGKENCYYLAAPIKTYQESECTGCSYAHGAPCVTACCYKQLDRWLASRRAAQKAGTAHACCLFT